MPIPIRCPSCQHTGTVPDNYVGQHIRCPKCRGKFRVEAPTADDATLLVEPEELLPPAPVMQSPVQPVVPVSLPASVPTTEQTRCPYCSELIQRTARKCKHCNEWLDPAMRKDAVQTGMAPLVVEEPPGQFDLTAGYAPPPAPAPRQERKPILAGAVFGGVLGVCLGLMLSQFWPVFGGFIERGLAEPLSPARLSLIPLHVFAFGFVGALLGGLAGGFLEYPARQTACLVGMLVVIAGSCGGCLMGNSTPRNRFSEASADEVTPALVGQQITIAGTVKLVSQDDVSFGEAMGGKKVPMKPILILNSKRGTEAICIFQTHDEAPGWMFRLNGGEEVSVEGQVSQVLQGTIQMTDCRLIGQPRKAK